MKVISRNNLKTTRHNASKPGNIRFNGFSVSEEVESGI
jgi:hypothetical protein